ncbi:MAG TPA: metalloregulator ArsR/SmtB family transcription factor [Candidatus Acidoferrales bacterium]|nr:metalloregulator ArsR/SmtB family transcription factor [Candidatus Acidoferrales bacterium]
MPRSLHPRSVFHALADPTRRAILVLLAHDERPVLEMAAPFRMSQPAISQHLRILRRAGLVSSRPAGSRRLYRIQPAPLREMLEWAEQFRHLLDPAGHAWAFGASSTAAAPHSRKKQNESSAP